MAIGSLCYFTATAMARVASVTVVYFIFLIWSWLSIYMFAVQTKELKDVKNPFVMNIIIHVLEINGKEFNLPIAWA